MIRDIIEQNDGVRVNSREVKLLKEHFGGCFNNEGKFDLEKFRTLIGDDINIVEENQGFNFLGKSYARMITGQESLTVIRPDEEHNSRPENRDSENIYISGDNLDALKHLVKSYAHEVKCIYIDPPYNTGEDDFTYNDKFNFTAKELCSKLGINIEQAEHILDMKKSSSASDAAWLTFMLPRLELAKDMLSKDGVIFISIDDNEQASLKLLCDEVFGVENFVANVIWQKRTSPDARLNLGPAHDYILVYARDIEKCKETLNKIELSPERRAEYKNPDNDPRGDWASVDITGQTGHATTSQFYKIVTPAGREYFPPEGRCWALAEKTFKELYDDNRLWFGVDGNSRPRKKVFINEVEGGNTWTWWPNTEVGHNQEASKELKEMFGTSDIFTNPKPTRLLKRILKLATSKDSLVMDFFSGSATTVDALTQLNAEDSGTRKYILVQIQEKVKEGSSAEKQGYSTIDEVGRERIRRAAAKIASENPLFKGDLGFKHYTLEDFDGDTIDRLYDFDMNAEINDNDLLSKFGAKTVLTTWLCRDGYGLNPKVTEVKLKDYTAYLCGKNLYLLDADFYADEMAELIDLMADPSRGFNPDMIVVFGYSMGYSTRLMLDKNLRALAEARGNKITLDVRY